MRELRAPTFKRELLQAVIDLRKIQTRQVMNPQPQFDGHCLRWPNGLRVPRSTRNEKMLACGIAVLKGLIKCAPHGQPGDVWALKEPIHLDGCTAIYADNTVVHDRRTGGIYDASKWHWKRDMLTSMHMPLWTARDFIDVTGVRVERLQDITAFGMRAEGVTSLLPVGYERGRELRQRWISLWDSLNAKPKPIYRQGCQGLKEGRGVATARLIHHYVSFPWEDVSETREHRGKPWYVIGNPWNWVYTFGNYQRDPGRPLPEVAR